MNPCGNTLVVPPFECAWLMDDHLRFPEPGRGCIAFEACARNDVTVVLKEKAGSQHYRTDSDPNYTIVIGSHRNRRLKIEVNGASVVDAPGVEVSPSRFERFWISICDGHITVGKGHPGKDAIVEWTHHAGYSKVQYVGLSSWDKHVGYRNIRVLPPYGNSAPFSSRNDHSTVTRSGVASFLGNLEFSDLELCLGSEQQRVPVHRLILACGCSNFPGSLAIVDRVISLSSVDYPTCHTVLKYLYTGQAEVPVAQLASVLEFSQVLGIDSLARQCDGILCLTSEEMGDDCIRKRCGDCTRKSCGNNICMMCESVMKSSDLLSGTPLSAINISKLESFFNTGDYADVEIFLDGKDHGIRAHRLILSAWSAPFEKMFTNGMHETTSIKINIRDVQADVFLTMLKFMYSAHLYLEEVDCNEWFLLSLLLLADRFSVVQLQQECSQKLHAALAEETVYPILQVSTLLPACESLQDACLELLANHFEHYSCCSMDFKELGFSSLKKILQSPDLSVTTEERVLNAIVFWASGDVGISGWREANDYLKEHDLKSLFDQRLLYLDDLLPYVRFAFLPVPLLRELESCDLSHSFPRMKELTKEALEYLAPDKEPKLCQEDLFQPMNVSNRYRRIQFIENNLKFSHRPSNMKELPYICDGDSNGVIYFAGTSYGAHPWVNPALTKKICVTASSPPSKCTDAKALVSRQYQGTCFAGPCFEGRRPTAWWKIDLGESHQLMCNHYTVRQDGSVNYMRSWSLQGSMDDEQWVDLKIHQEAKTLNHSGQYASWPIHGANALLPFRYFRIILTGPTTSNTHPWNLCLCYIELYGYFL